jgi:hypothetical protein
MEEQGIAFLEKELVRGASRYGIHRVELLQDSLDPSFFIGIAEWDSLEEARSFQARFIEKEKELMKYCSSTPTRHFCKVRGHLIEKWKKAA